MYYSIGISVLYSILFLMTMIFSNKSYAAKLDIDYNWMTERDFSYSVRDIDYSSLPFPSVCVSKNSCYVCVHWAHSNHLSKNWPVKCTQIRPSGPFTWDVLGEDVRRNHLPLTGRFSIPSEIKTPLEGNGWKFCVVFQQRSLTTAVGNFATLCDDYGITVPVVPDPGAPPPPPLSCSIGGDITLDHGILDSHYINDHTKSVNVLVSCTRAVTARITTQADLVTLRADGSLTSQLKVNGINGATGTTIPVPGANGTNVQFSSTLMSNGDVAAGAFSGSAVAVVTII